MSPRSMTWKRVSNKITNLSLPILKNFKRHAKVFWCLFGRASAPARKTRKPPENQADEIQCPHPFSNSSWLSHGHCRGRCHFFVVFFVDLVSPLEGRGSSSFCLSARLASRQLEGRRSTPVEGLQLGRGALLPWADGGIEPRLLPPPRKQQRQRQRQRRQQR